jgi:hypothetical protein
MQAGIQKLPKDLGSYLESHVAFWPSLTAGLTDNTLGANHSPAQAAHPGQPVEFRLQEGELLVFMRLACAKDEILRYHQSTGFLSMQRQRMIRWPKNLKTWL